MKKKIAIFCCLLLLGLTACSNTPQEEIEKEENKMDQVIESGNYVVVDVRTKEEYEESHIKESINIPYDEINENTSLPKEKTIFVYCRSGKRSSIAYQTLKDLGYDVIDLGAFDSITIFEKE